MNLTFFLLLRLNLCQGFDNLLIMMGHQDNFDFFFKVYSYLVLSQSNIHLTILVITYLTLSLYKVCFFIIIIFPIVIAEALKVPYVIYQEFSNYLGLELLLDSGVSALLKESYHPIFEESILLLMVY